MQALIDLTYLVQAGGYAAGGWAFWTLCTRWSGKPGRK